MTDFDTTDWATLDRYLSGDLDAPERTAFDARLNAWRAAHPAQAGQLERLRSAIFLTQQIAERTDVPALLTRLRQARMHPAVPARTRQRKTEAGQTRWMTGVTASAIATMLAIVGIVGIIGVRSVISPSTSWLLHRATTQPSTYATRTGEWAKITLVDGTRITLAPKTTLVTMRDFGARTRELSLIGQAQFDVRNATSTPFIVHTGSVATRVLGTVFDVTRYAHDSTTQVAVTSGKVVSGATHTVTLNAGQIANVTDSTAVASTRSDLRDYTDWTTGRIHFQEAPIRNVLTTVGRWYGLEFRLTDPTLAAQHITATFSATSTADAIAKLTLLLDVSATIHDSVVTLHARHRADPTSETHPPQFRRFDHMNPTLSEVGR